MGFITFKTIGESGNLGSQLPQYSSLFAIANETGRDIIFPESSLNMGYGFKFADLCDIDIITKPDDFFNNFIDIKPDDTKLVDDLLIPKMNPQINYNIVNRFDLYKYWYPRYFKNIMDFKWNPNYKNLALQKYKSLIPTDKEIVAIHVRRGDYLLPQHSHFCHLDNSYYSEALAPFIKEIEKYHFLIFSNDIEWCKKYLIQGEMVTFVEQGDDYIDLITMSMCDHFIIANSSYSWWAAFKSESNLHKKVYCPTNYLRNHSPWKHINGNYYPSTWNNINNFA